MRCFWLISSNNMDLFSPQNLEILGQLTLAALLGICVGIERNIAHKSAGMRTFALVAIGAALFTMISQTAYAVFGSASGFDPSRITAQIVVGIGFLAGGLVIFNQHEVHRLTTGTALWVSAAIGMAVGFHFYALAIFGTLLTVFILAALWAVETHIFKSSHGNGASSKKGQ